MRRKQNERRLIHRALQVLTMVACTAVGLFMVACEDDEGDYEVVDETQRDHFGGVRFPSKDPRTEARVDLSPTFEGQPVKWSVPKNQPFAVIPDPGRSTELIVLRPEGVTRTEVTVEGVVQPPGLPLRITRRIHVSSW